MSTYEKKIFGKRAKSAQWPKQEYLVSPCGNDEKQTLDWPVQQTQPTSKSE